MFSFGCKQGHLAVALCEIHWFYDNASDLIPVFKFFLNVFFSNNWINHNIVHKYCVKSIWDEKNMSLQGDSDFSEPSQYCDESVKFSIWGQWSNHQDVVRLNPTGVFLLSNEWKGKANVAFLPVDFCSWCGHLDKFKIRKSNVSTYWARPAMTIWTSFN